MSVRTITTKGRHRMRVLLGLPLPGKGNKGVDDALWKQYEPLRLALDQAIGDNPGLAASIFRDCLGKEGVWLNGHGLLDPDEAAKRAVQMLQAGEVVLTVRWPLYPHD